MNIAHREVSPAHPPLVIAGIGINPGGSPQAAKETIRLAALSRCECIKHQTHILEDEHALRACTQNVGLIDVFPSASRTAAIFRNSGDVAGCEFDQVLGNRLIRLVKRNTQLKGANLD